MNSSSIVKQLRELPQLELTKENVERLEACREEIARVMPNAVRWTTLGPFVLELIDQLLTGSVSNTGAPEQVKELLKHVQPCSFASLSYVRTVDLGAVRAWAEGTNVIQLKKVKS